MQFIRPDWNRSTFINSILIFNPLCPNYFLPISYLNICYQSQKNERQWSVAWLEGVAVWGRNDSVTIRLQPIIAQTVKQHVSYEFIWIQRWQYQLNVHCCVLFSRRVRVRIRFTDVSHTVRKPRTDDCSWRVTDACDPFLHPTTEQTIKCTLR